MEWLYYTWPKMKAWSTKGKISVKIQNSKWLYLYILTYFSPCSQKPQCQKPHKRIRFPLIVMYISLVTPVLKISACEEKGENLGGGLDLWLQHNLNVTHKCVCVCAEWLRLGVGATHFLHVAIKEWTETKPVLSPPAQLNMGAFQYSGHPHAWTKQQCVKTGTIITVTASLHGTSITCNRYQVPGLFSTADGTPLL